MDPTLARNKYSPFFQHKKSKNSNNNNSAPEDRDANQESREDKNETRDNDDPPKMVTIPPPQQEEELESSFIDTFGDVVVDANDALVAIVCDNKEVTKTIFPYVDGEFAAIETETENSDNNAVGNEDKKEEEEHNSVNDFYTGVNHTLSEEGFEATPTALYAVERSNNGDGDGVVRAAVVAGAAAGAGVFSIGKLGMLKKKKRQKKGKKKGEKSSSDGKPEAEAEAEAEITDDSCSGEGQEVQRGQAVDNTAETQCLTQEADVLLSIYDPELDNSKRAKQGVQVQVDEDEGTIVEGQDLELEMLGERNVLALGFGAFAICSGDDNTIVTTDQRELTLQDYSSNQARQQMEPILEDESNDNLDSDHAKKKRRELRQQKRVLLGRMKAKNLRAARKSLAAQESRSEQSSRPKPVVANDNEKLSAKEPIVEDEDTIATSENWECTLDDYERPKLISRIPTFKSKSGKASLENDDDLIPTSEDALKKDANKSSNNISQVGNVKVTSEQPEPEIPVQTLITAFSDDGVMLRSFEVDDGVSMQSSISLATELRKYSAGVDLKDSAEVDSRYTEYVSSDEESEASSKDTSRKASSWWNMFT